MTFYSYSEKEIGKIEKLEKENAKLKEIIDKIRQQDRKAQQFVNNMLKSAGFKLTWESE
jgi:hypothetical protein